MPSAWFHPPPTPRGWSHSSMKFSTLGMKVEIRTLVKRRTMGSQHIIHKPITYQVSLSFLVIHVWNVPFLCSISTKESVRCGVEERCRCWFHGAQVGRWTWGTQRNLHSYSKVMQMSSAPWPEISLLLGGYRCLSVLGGMYVGHWLSKCQRSLELCRDSWLPSPPEPSLQPLVCMAEQGCRSLKVPRQQNNQVAGSKGGSKFYYRISSGISNCLG